MKKSYHSESYIKNKYANYGDELHKNIMAKYNEIINDIRVIGELSDEKDYKRLMVWAGFLAHDKEYLAYLKGKANEIDRTR